MTFKTKFYKVTEYIFGLSKTKTILRHNNPEGECELEDNLIFIPYNLAYNYKLYTLLHECGHIVMDFNSEKYSKMFEKAWNKTISQAKMTHSGIIDYMRFETEAWDIGWEIAEQLKLDISYEKYYSYARGNLWSYFCILGNKKQKDCFEYYTIKKEEKNEN